MVMSGHDQPNYSEAERTYDGPLPEPLRFTLRAGSSQAAARCRAEAELRLLETAIRERRTVLAGMARERRRSAARALDLPQYRRAWRRWRAALATL
jgi:hypothetical protein